MISITQDDKPLNESFKKKIEMVQYNSALMITGAIKGTCHDKTYQEVGLESLADRRWSRKLIFFHKIILRLQPTYFQNYFTSYDNVKTYFTQSSNEKPIKNFSGITKAFDLSFFPPCAKEWGNLNAKLRNINSINMFKSSILNFVRRRENLVFAIHDINGLKLLTRLRLDFSHLNEHKFRHNDS